MKTSRRKFFKVVAGGLGAIALSAIIPYRPSFAQIEQEPEDDCKLVPEIWSKKLQKELYKKYFLGRLKS